MLITLVLLLSTGSLLRVESHQSSNLTSSSPPSSSSLNRQYHQSISTHHYVPSSSSTNGGLSHGHPTAVARRNLQQPSHYQQHHHHNQQLSGPSSSTTPGLLSSNGNSNVGSSLIRRFWPNPPQSHSSPSSGPSSSIISSLAPISFLERRPSLFRGSRAEPGFLDVLESAAQEIRVLPGSGSLRGPHSSPPPPPPPPPPPHRHNRQLGQRPSKPEMTITELKDISQIPKILRAVKDRIQSMPGLKAFLLTKDGPSGPKIKPSILLTAPEEYSSKPGQLIWRLLNSKSTKGSTSFAKSLSSLTSRSRYPSQPHSSGSILSSPPPPSQQQQSSPSPNSPSSGPQSQSDKYAFIEVPSAIDLDGTSPFSESPFPNENIIINTSEQTESTPDEILIESSDNQNGNNVNNHIGNSIGNTNNQINNNFNTLNGPIQTAESIAEAIEEIPRTYYYRDTTEPKGYHHGPSGDYLQATSSIRDNSFSSSPFTVNEHVPLSPVHNGWIPKNSKHWSPGAYRSAFYTPDTRLIKFTIHDRVSGSAKQSASPSIPIGTYIHPSLSINPVKSKINNNNNQLNVNNNQLNSVNSNVNSNSNNYQQSNSRNSLSSKYNNNDYFNHPSLIEESYNINDDELIKTTTTTTTTTTSPTTITTITTPNSPPSTINKVPIVATLTPSSSSSSSDDQLTTPPSFLTSQHDKSTESSTPITTIRPSA
ncbi:probable inactive serine/threonine-protein kinase scy2 [Panonychus citri]|uniref:probable inactive serine/threonine-protein kinase scy2 n=1 Tax=Panonychus citri TaxID=50023 RepID=UPI0023074A1A|nr:probable inactive serine/threonine-protein kinase scy2 [Panonychus citri]